MFVCDNCGSEFESPKLRMEDMGEYWGAPAWEPWGICPSCGSEEIEEEDYCPMCDSCYPANGRNYCDSCFTIVNDKFQSFINELASDWKFKRDNIIEVITDIIEAEA